MRKQRQEAPAATFEGSSRDKGGNDGLVAGRDYGRQMAGEAGLVEDLVEAMTVAAGMVYGRWREGLRQDWWSPREGNNETGRWMQIGGDGDWWSQDDLDEAEAEQRR
ncbi:hypothetical protein Scep_015016 [Stephania cephalantha]|uniref:Uncharacterized protein n=1 Tax=Stephania cephalantha TaxID=152367 RepID=A0AAP0J363_9MAGN